MWQRPRWRNIPKIDTRLPKIIYGVLGSLARRGMGNRAWQMGVFRGHPFGDSDHVIGPLVACSSSSTE